jgi:hypothetical protein
MRLEKASTHKVEVKLCQTKPFHTKSQKLKDYLFIKGDYFDQKIPIGIYPGSLHSKTISSLSSSFQRDTANNHGESFGRAPQTDEDVDFLRDKVACLTNENAQLRDQIDSS